MKRRYIYLLLSILSAFLASVPAFAAVKKVGPGQTYSTISAAVGAASANDVIELCGDITESGTITISKSLTIQSAEGHKYTVSTQGSSNFFSLSGGCTLALDNVAFDGGGAGICFMNISNANAVLNIRDVVITRFGQVLNMQSGSCTIESGTFSYNTNTITSGETDGNTSIFNVGGSYYEAVLTINGGEFIGNNTAVGPIFHLSTGVKYTQYITYKPQLILHGGHFAGNNLSNHGEVIRVGYGDEYQTQRIESIYYYSRYYCTVKVSGEPIFEEGQYIFLDRWLNKDKSSDTPYYVYDCLPCLVKDNEFSSDARINVSTNLNNGLRNLHDLDFLVSDGYYGWVCASDVNVFNRTYTDIYKDENPVTVKVKYSGPGSDPSLQFTYPTTITITRYGLQCGDSAIYNIYHEENGDWVRVHSVSLTGLMTGTSTTRTINLPIAGKFKIEETDFNWKYNKTDTAVDGKNASVLGQGSGTAESSGSSNSISFEVRGGKKTETVGIGTETIKQNIFHFVQHSSGM